MFLLLLLFNPMAESHHFSDGNPLQISYEKDEKWKRLISLTSLLFFFFLLATSPASSAGDADSTVITLGDYQGLQAFRHSLQDPHGVLHSWNDTGLAACSGGWVGIKCVMGKVVAIQLPWRGLSGRISEKLGQLTALRKLSLHDNAIGGQIPTEIGFLPDLRGLHLFNNRFSGTLPPSIGRCRLLQTIDLSNNLIIGSIPPSIANSTMLIKLNLSYNNLTGAIPTTIATNPSLNHISLDHNSLSGSIPDAWGGAGRNQIQFLSLDHNLLSGSIPISLTNLAGLKDASFSNNQINGAIPKGIGEMQSLQTLDLSGNSIGGSLPESISKLTSLVRLNLGRNQIYGVIPESIGGMKKLEVLSLEHNGFSGVIPAMIGDISGLSELDLSDNNLTGAIPISLERLTGLAFFNVSDNGLFGPVPSVLSVRFNSSSFRGNIQLCGYRGSLPCPSAPFPSLRPPSRNSRRLSNRDIILVSCGAVILLLLLLCCVLLCCLLRKRSRLGQKSKFRGEKPGSGAEAEAEAGGEAGGKLVHFDGPFVFTKDDLLCATAEIMGKSTYGTVYKATLDDGNQVAVKRLREKMAKGQREFETEVNALGQIRHPNLLALRAYYLGPKGEKLLVFDFLPRGSLAAYLHARGPDTPIDWAARMKIAMGAARGLSYLHNEMSMIHGNLTSSNILLDEGTNAEIADYGLSRLMTPVANSDAGTLGYRAPELLKLKKANTRTDVYSLGVVMLELLTGKSPGEMMNGIELPQWVASIVREEWTNEVFDLELMKDAAGTAGDELLNTLKLALHCVDPSPVARPEVQQVLQQLEEIKPELAGSGGGGAAEATSPSLIDS